MARASLTLCSLHHVRGQRLEFHQATKGRRCARCDARSSSFPYPSRHSRMTPRSDVSAGPGGQWGAASSTAGVYAACVKLREAVAQKVGFNSALTECLTIS
jgi:hypothetical protein